MAPKENIRVNLGQLIDASMQLTVTSFKPEFFFRLAFSSTALLEYITAIFFICLRNKFPEAFFDIYIQFLVLDTSISYR